MIKDINTVVVSGKIFWSKLDERENYSTLRLGIDIGEGSYNRIFATVSNPHEKAHQFVKTDNQVMLVGAWLDTWKKEDGTKDLQVKAYDSNCQFYLPEVRIPHMNEVTLYGKVDSYADGLVTLNCIGGRNPKTSQYTHRYMDINIGDSFGDVAGKKLFIRGSLGTEDIDGKGVLTISADYDKIYIMG
jgi:hypothetical protein